MYIARKRLKIDGVYREIGQEVPEALQWRTVESYVRAGVLDWVEDAKPEPKKKAKSEKPAPVVEEIVEPTQKLIEAVERLEGIKAEKPSEEKTAK